MKKFIFNILLLFFISTSFSQEEIEIVSFCISEESFPGGDEAFLSYLNKNIRYPERALKENIEGTVHIRFSVQNTGKIGKVKLEKGIDNCPECNQEAIRLIKNMPDWYPESMGGKTYSSYLSVPIVFKIKK